MSPESLLAPNAQSRFVQRVHALIDHSLRMYLRLTRAYNQARATRAAL
jgi:hypothetical protein